MYRTNSHYVPLEKKEMYEHQEDIAMRYWVDGKGLMNHLKKEIGR